MLSKLDQRAKTPDKTIAAPTNRFAPPANDKSLESQRDQPRLARP